MVMTQMIKRGAVIVLLLLAAVATMAGEAGPYFPDPVNGATCQTGDRYYKTLTDPNGSQGDYWCDTYSRWTAITPLPSGSIIMITSGTCPSGTTEVAALDGVTVIGTLAAHGDVGGTGGSNSLTPAGTVSAPVFTGSVVASAAISAGTPAGTNSAPTFTGTLNALAHSGTAVTAHSYTPAGTNAAPAFTGTAWTPPAIAWPAGVPTFAGSALATHQHEIPFQLAGSTTARSLGAIYGSGASYNSTGAYTGAASVVNQPAVLTQAISGGTPAGTVAWPAGVPTIGAFTPAGTVAAPVFTGTLASLTHTVTQPNDHAYTPLGTVSAPVFTGSALGTHQHNVTAAGTNSVPTFTGSVADNRSAYLKVIFCVAP
jgi:hypothetical protein